jgi:hypothetical protein
MRYRDFAFSRTRRAIDPDVFVTRMNEAVEMVIDVTLDTALKFSDHLPWSADEITSHVEAFVSKYVPDLERCPGSERASWDDQA